MKAPIKNPAFLPSDTQEPAAETFTNPIFNRTSPDPSMLYDGQTGYYYALFTSGDGVYLHRSETVEGFKEEKEVQCVFAVGEESGIYGCVWAPEMHKIDGVWYIYTSGTVSTEKHDLHLFVLKSKTSDPFDGFTFEGILNPDFEAIDPTVYTHTDGKLYICYARLGGGNILHLHEMASPTRLGERSVKIAEAELPFELRAVSQGISFRVNEGPYFVKNGDRLFIIYSANECWCNDYCLGVIEYMGGDFLQAESWYKYPDPILTSGNGNYATGHAMFFYSPDGTELWVSYHAMHEPDDEMKPMPRYMHIQRVYFDETGFPYIGAPIPTGVPFPAPSRK